MKIWRKWQWHERKYENVIIIIENNMKANGRMENKTAKIWKKITMKMNENNEEIKAIIIENENEQTMNMKKIMTIMNEICEEIIMYGQ